MRKILFIITLIITTSNLFGQGGYFRPNYIGWPPAGWDSTEWNLTLNPATGKGRWSNPGSGSDSIFEGGVDTLCFIVTGDTTCVPLDSTYVTEDEICFIYLGDTTCIPYSTVSGNIYTIDGALTGNRTLTTNNFNFSLNKGGVEVFRITPTGSSPTMYFNHNIALDNQSLFHLRNTNTGGNIYFTWYGNTGSQRYSFGVDRASNKLLLSHGTDLGLGDSGSITGDAFFMFSGDNDLIETKKDIQFYSRVLDAGGNAGTAGQVLTSTVTGVEWAASGVGAEEDSIPINQLKNATATRTLDNANYLQEWRWNTLSGSALKLSTTSTVQATASRLLHLDLSGAHSNSNQFAYGVSVSNTKTGTASVNYGVHSTVSGGTTNRAIAGTTTGGTTANTWGVWGDATTGTGVHATATSGTGLSASVTTGLALNLASGTSTTNTVESMITMRRESSSIVGNGMGSSIDFNLETVTTNNVQNSNSIISKWLDATTATATSQFEITGTNSAAPVTHLTITGAGIFTLVQGLPNYADDAAAAAGGIPIGGLYRNGSIVMIRVS